MKKERGAITIITLTTILFMLAFLISTFVIVANRRQAQAEIKSETKKIYEEDVDNVDQIYADYFAAEIETIPINTVEDLFKVATGEYIVDGEKIYKCTASANYRLKADIEFEVNDYSSEYSDLFETTTYTRWINIEKQKENGTLTGTFNYNTYSIKETDSNGTVITHNGEN